MQLSVITSSDDVRRERYEIARAIFAETCGGSLRAAECLASMIDNAARVSNCRHVDVVRNSELFTSRIPSSPRYAFWRAPADSSGFQMCLRVVQKMQKGTLGDLCCGATRFHHDDVIPAWATARGYIADVDGILFYA